MRCLAQPAGCPKPHRGTTLIELVTCLAVAAVLVALAYPSLLHWRARLVVGQTTDLLVAAIETARVAALAWRLPVTLSPLSDGTSLDAGWQLRLGDLDAGNGRAHAGTNAGTNARTSDMERPGMTAGRVLSAVRLPDACLTVVLRATASAASPGTLTMTPVGYSRTGRGGLVAATFIVRCRDAERQVRLGAQGRLRVCAPGIDADCDAAGSTDPD